MKNVSDKKLKLFLENLFCAAGLNKSQAKTMAHGLLYASLRGVDSHGIRLTPHYISSLNLGRINKTPKFKFVKKSGATATLNADHGFGIVAGTLAMERAVELAKKYGVAAVGVKNSSHFGAAGIFSSLAAEHGMIGLSFTHTDALVVPFGGKSPFLGTNPICFAAPVADEQPFCLDMATTNISWNKLVMYQKQSLPLKEGWAVDNKGEIVTNSRNAVALLPMGGYKGYGLSLMVEILSSLLTGMPYGRNISRMLPSNKNKRFLGHCFIALDVAHFQPLLIFKKRMKLLLDSLRGVKPAKGVSRVLVAGDPEKIVSAERSRKGIPVPPELVEQLNDLAVGLKLTIKL